MNEIKLPFMDCENVSQEIGDFIIQSVLEIHATGCVIGLSGGIDSATTAYLIHKAFRAYNNKVKEKQLELVGYILPSSCNAKEDALDGISVAKELNIRYEVKPIEDILNAFKSTNPEIFNQPYHVGNLMSRIRANILSTKAAGENKVLAGTGNNDEDFGIGYYTLFGDGAVHISPIGGLSKRLVYIISKFLGVPEKIIQRIPTAGLESGQSDFKDLGYDYDMVEIVTQGLSQGFSEDELKENGNVQSLAEKQMTRYNQIFGEKKYQTVSSMTDDIFKRHRIALSKARIIHPPIPEISLQYV